MAFLPLVFGMNKHNHYFVPRPIRCETLVLYRATRWCTFASEVKALLAHPTVQASVNVEGLASMMAVGPSRAPGKTLFQNIKELRPGYAMRFSREEGLKSGHIGSYKAADMKNLWRKQLSMYVFVNGCYRTSVSFGCTHLYISFRRTRFQYYHWHCGK